MKRSQAVSLVLLGGAAVAAIVIAEHDPSQDEEDVLVYPNAEACIGAAVRSEADCRSAYEAARAAYPDSAPRYGAMSACEAHHGATHCVPGESVTEAARSQFVPLMAAYVVGRTVEQALTPQPVYDHAPQNAAAAGSSGGYYGFHGGYCTGWGGRIQPAGGGAAAHVASSAVRSAAFGGFGGTGRSYASTGGSAGRSGFGG